VQGKLLKTYLKVQIDTVCAHCSTPMRIEIDSDLNCKVNDDDCKPLIFIPDIGLSNIRDEGIIDSF